MAELMRENWETNIVGKAFLDYYRSLGYRELPGSSLLTPSLPMTFVMSAGMVQFEELAGSAKPGDHYTLIQNCFRHFDLESVGKSAIHLSLFRMPAAFDFGVVDRKMAVGNIWHLLIDVYGFDARRMAVTYFGGGKVDDTTVLEDCETREAWQRVSPPPGSLTALAYPGNFWKQSARLVGKRNSRKCGPTTEIFYDRGPQFACGVDCQPGCACGRFIEFLNTLFITHEVGRPREPLRDLAIPFTETVIGLERTASLLQGKFSVYETEDLHVLVQQVRCFEHIHPETPPQTRSFYENVIVDHLRALAFLTTDGAPPPGQGGRRRLMRRLVRELLGAKIPLNISDPGFERSMLQATLDLHPQLTEARTLILHYLDEEAERFRAAVDKTMEQLAVQVAARGGLLPEEKTLQQIAKQCGVPLFATRFLLEQKRYHQPRTSVAAKPLCLIPQVKTELPARKCRAHALEKIFINAFRELGYRQLPESSLVDDSIPMSFVMSAGLAQVERGAERLRASGQQRFLLAQNCFRHFDVERVGPSDIHLSLFRMLGIFTFGKIDQRAEIHKAIMLITGRYLLPPERLWATYYQGGEISGYTFPQDNETCAAWIDCGIPAGHVIGLNRNHNFWQQSAQLMGSEHARKCGPNTELFFDRGEQYSCGADCQPGCNCGRFVEFLNMLFITWNLDTVVGTLNLLEEPFTEMVIGVERLAMLLQKADSLYHVDTVQPLYDRVKQAHRSSDIHEEGFEYSLRVITDHLRALAFLVADGAPPPGKGGRAYIIRKLIRETAQNQRRLGITSSHFLPEMVQQTANMYGKIYPPIAASQNNLLSMLQSEYERMEAAPGKIRKEKSMSTNKIIQIMRSVHHNLPASIQADRFYGLLYDRVRQEIQFPYAAEGNHELMVEQKHWQKRPLAKEEQLPDALLAQKMAYRIDNCAGQSIKIWSPNHKPLAWLGVPLIVGDDVIGVLVVENWHRPGAFDEGTARTLMLIARQAASALENVMLFERLERKVRLLKMLNQAGQRLSSFTQVQEATILNLIVSQAQQIGMDTQNLYIAMYDPDIDAPEYYDPDHPEKSRINGVLKFVLAFEAGQQVKIEEHPEWQPRQAGSGLTEYVIRTKNSCNPLDILAAYENLARDYLGRIPRSWLGVPMLAEDRVIGVIVLRNYEYAHLYTAEDQEFLEILAGQAAVAIQNARLYQDLIREQGKVSASEKMLTMSDVANMFAHRMNNLAGTIPIWVNRTRSLLDSNDPRDQKIFRNLDHIYDDSKIILEAAQRIKESSDPRVKELVSINALLEIALSRAFAARPGSEECVTVKKVFNPQLPMINIEKDTLQEVIDNLTRNAIEAILPNSGQVSITTGRTSEKGKDWVWIAVGDNGSGISQDQLPKIFDLFFTTKSSGLGFGLWRAKTFMRQVGGDIDVDSQLGKGTTFTLKIPINAAISTASSKESAAERQHP